MRQPPKPIGLVFSDLKLAKKELERLVNDLKCPCCVYKVTYGHGGVEYRLKTMADVIDQSSKNILVVLNPKIEPVVKVPLQIAIMHRRDEQTGELNYFAEAIGLKNG